MARALADVVPLALAIALSPFPMIPAILLLFTARPRATGGGFLAGWAIGIATVVMAVAALAGGLEGRDQPPAWAAPTRIVLGLALLALGVRKWLRRRETKGAPAWMAALDEATPTSALKVGLLLSAANPKIVLLAAATSRPVRVRARRGAGQPPVPVRSAKVVTQRSCAGVSTAAPA